MGKPTFQNTPGCFFSTLNPAHSLSPFFAQPQKSHMQINFYRPLRACLSSQSVSFAQMHGDPRPGGSQSVVLDQQGQHLGACISGVRPRKLRLQEFSTWSLRSHVRIAAFVCAFRSHGCTLRGQSLCPPGVILGLGSASPEAKPETRSSSWRKERYIPEKGQGKQTGRWSPRGWPSAGPQGELRSMNSVPEPVPFEARRVDLSPCHREAMSCLPTRADAKPSGCFQFPGGNSQTGEWL